VDPGPKSCFSGRTGSGSYNTFKPGQLNNWQILSVHNRIGLVQESFFKGNMFVNKDKIDNFEEIYEKILFPF
jgi:hypothetical protein